MPHRHRLSSYSSSFLPPTSEQNQQVQDRLALYQVFLRIYEQNRDLLNGILELENSGNHLLASTTLTYVQGVVAGGMTYLVTNLVAGKTQVFNQGQSHWTIGRDSRSAILPIADRRLSRRHAAIAYNTEQQVFKLIDMGSTNGTFINEEQIVQPQALQDGDRIRLGGVSFTFFTYELPIPVESIIMLGDTQQDAELSDTPERYKRTAEMESEPERRKSLSDDCAEDTMMVLRPGGQNRSEL